MRLEDRARAIRLAIFDVDGVLTDGTLYLGADGEAFKAFNILDGHGIRMLQDAGVATAIISGRESAAVARRAAELSIAHVVQKAGDKVAEFDKLAARLQIDARACAFMGDDLPDHEVHSVGQAKPVSTRLDEGAAFDQVAEELLERGTLLTR